MVDKASLSSNASFAQLSHDSLLSNDGLTLNSQSERSTSSNSDGIRFTFKTDSESSYRAVQTAIIRAQNATLNSNNFDNHGARVTLVRAFQYVNSSVNDSGLTDMASAGSTRPNISITFPDSVTIEITVTANVGSTSSHLSASVEWLDNRGDYYLESVENVTV